MIDFNEDEPTYEPEDCEECGCQAGDFEDSDFKDGAWYCPECGQPQ